MSVPLTLLGLLEREPSHGYDLKRDYDALFGRGKPLPFGQVYSTLGRLARDGKVTAGGSEPGAGPDRKQDGLTDLGLREVVAQPGEAGRAAGPLRPVPSRARPAVDRPDLGPPRAPGRGGAGAMIAASLPTRDTRPDCVLRAV